MLHSTIKKHFHTLCSVRVFQCITKMLRNLLRLLVRILSLFPFFRMPHSKVTERNSAVWQWAVL